MGRGEHTSPMFTIGMVRKGDGLMTGAGDGQRLVVLCAIARRVGALTASGGAELDITAFAP